MIQLLNFYPKNPAFFPSSSNLFFDSRKTSVFEFEDRESQITQKCFNVSALDFSATCFLPSLSEEIKLQPKKEASLEPFESHNIRGTNSTVGSTFERAGSW